MLGTDTFRHSAARVIACPFTGERLAALPALYPDVAAIHVHEADRYGNCRIRGTTVADLDLARAAKRLIVTCERLIPDDEIRRDPSRTVIPFFCVDAVCEVPYGSYPGNMPYEYFSDEEHLRRWLDVETRPGGVPAVPRRVHLTASRTSRSTCTRAAACRACRSCGGRNSCCIRAREARSRHVRMQVDSVRTEASRDGIA